MLHFIDALLPSIVHFKILAYLIVLVAAFLESLAFVGLIFPGTVLITLFGFFAAKGDVNLAGVMLFAIIGAVCGDGLSFSLGKRGTGLFRSGHRIFTANSLAWGERFFKRHGNKSIFLGRFVGPIRPIVPFVAGMFNMSLQSFLLWNVLSAFAWSISYIMLGYFFGQSWQMIRTWSTRMGIFLVMIVTFLLGLYVLKWWITNRGKQWYGLIRSIASSIKDAVAGNPDVQLLTKRHARLFGFLRSRLRTDQFSGLPLTLLLLAFVYTLGLFLGVVEDIITADPIVAADVRIVHLLYTFRTPAMIHAFLWITFLGNWQIIISATGIVSIIFLLWRQKPYVLSLWVVLLGSELFKSLGKMVFHRPRPELAVYLEHSFAFPSGHATIAVAFYGFIAFCLWQRVKKWKPRLNILLATMVIVVAIGFSRLYLGVHYLSDVWGGYLLGLLWLILGISMTEWMLSKRMAGQQTPRPVAGAKMISLALIMAEGLLFVILGAHFHPAVRQPTTVPAHRVITGDPLKLFSNNALPRFTETLTGTRQEPLNLLVVASNDRTLIDAFEKAGWYVADPVAFGSMVRAVQAVITNQSYPTAPITPYFWHGMVHDYGLEKPSASQSIRERHHIRFWRTPFKTADGNKIYVGTASLDIGIKWGVTHTISPDIDTERDFVFHDLQRRDLVLEVHKEQFVDPVLGQNFTGDRFFSDGKVYIVVLQ
jgi:undecaprenyl-diphosphatase